MGNLNSRDKVIVEKAREEGEKAGWDDLHYLTDEELLIMYPPDGFLQYEEPHYHREYDAEDEERLLEIIKELSSIYEDIAYSEAQLEDPKIYYNERTEIRSDIINLRRKATRLLAESEEIVRKYEGRSK